MARYKEQALNKVANLENKMRTLDFMISRAQSQDEIREFIVKIQEQLEDLRSMISLEHDEFQTYI